MTDETLTEPVNGLHDYVLKFESEEQAEALLYKTVPCLTSLSKGEHFSWTTPRYKSVDMIGPLGESEGYFAHVQNLSPAPELTQFIAKPRPVIQPRAAYA